MVIFWLAVCLGFYICRWFFKNFDVKRFFENLLKVRRNTLPSESKEIVPTVPSESRGCDLHLQQVPSNKEKGKCEQSAFYQRIASDVSSSLRCCNRMIFIENYCCKLIFHTNKNFRKKLKEPFSHYPSSKSSKSTGFQKLPFKLFFPWTLIPYLLRCLRFARWWVLCKL